MRRTLPLYLALSMVLGLPAASADAAELSGTVLLEKGTRASKEVQKAIVYFTPRSKTSVQAPGQPFEVITVKKEFVPRALVVPVGSTVRFPNQDNILHNVFSVSGENRFDLGLYRRGEGKETTFEHPGIVKIFCNVHHSMVSYVLVLDTPHHTTAATDGRFRLSGLPAGPGTLTVWHERSELWQQDVEVPTASGLEVRLKITKPRVPRHKNKFGRAYERRKSGRAYR